MRLLLLTTGWRICNLHSAEELWSSSLLNKTIFDWCCGKSEDPPPFLLPKFPGYFLERSTSALSTNTWHQCQNWQWFKSCVSGQGWRSVSDWEIRSVRPERERDHPTCWRNNSHLVPACLGQPDFGPRDCPAIYTVSHALLFLALTHRLIRYTDCWDALSACQGVGVYLEGRRGIRSCSFQKMVCQHALSCLATRLSASPRSMDVAKDEWHKKRFEKNEIKFYFFFFKEYTSL